MRKEGPAETAEARGKIPPMRLHAFLIALA
jgi:hypothetical protein